VKQAESDKTFFAVPFLVSYYD